MDLLVRQPAEVIDQRLASLAAATDSPAEVVRAAGYAGLIAFGHRDTASRLASRGDAHRVDWARSVLLIPDVDVRATLQSELVGLVEDSQANSVRLAAIQALSSIPSLPAETFELLASLVAVPSLRDAAVGALLQVPPENRSVDASRQIVEQLLQYAMQTPPEQRTDHDFVEAMQLADQLLARLPIDQAREFRARLREISVRVVLLRTVLEEMRYDQPYFAVEAGRSIQLILKNEDLMPHNLVIATPGNLQKVAELGLAAGPDGGYQGKQYVPASDLVLHATDMVPAGGQERMTFTAPAEPGEYPYVCTFPRHWMRMYGVMVVVPDLDQWLSNPSPPADPLGSNRSFVRHWRVDDLEAELDRGLRGRSPEIGRRIYAEATCAQCHRLAGEGGAVGPELTDVMQRWKGDRAAVLREILEPSHRIEPKYAVHLVVTDEGRTFSGIISAQDKRTISLLVNPESGEPTVIQRDRIEELVQTATSMMPKALLDEFTKDEIFELLAYLETAQLTAE